MARYCTGSPRRPTVHCSPTVVVLPMVLLSHHHDYRMSMRFLLMTTYLLKMTRNHSGLPRLYKVLTTLLASPSFAQL